MSYQESNSDSSNRVNLIQTVQTPLGFFVLLVLVVEVILGITANLSQGEDRTYLIRGMMVLIFTLLVIVAGLAIFRPEALRGQRPREEITPFVSKFSEVSLEDDEIDTQLEHERKYPPDPKLVRFTPPLNPERFHTVDLVGRFGPPNYYKWKFSPTGVFLAYDIPFFLQPVYDSDGNPLGHKVIDLQPSRENVGMIRSVPVNMQGVKFVHFLLSAGHGWRMHKGVPFLYKRIGFIQLVSTERATQRIHLILGKNIREWYFSHSPNLVTELDDDRAKPAWLSHDSSRRFDLFTVEVDNAPMMLESIGLHAVFEESHPSIDTPSIIISGITCERDITATD